MSALARFLASAAPLPNAPAGPLVEELDRLGFGELARGNPMLLHHGTTASFSEFDPSRCRRELVDVFYGGNVFFTPSRAVASEYAWAPRNAALPASLLDELAAHNPPAGAFLRTIHARGRAGWEEATRAAGHWREHPGPGEGLMDFDGLRAHLGVDPDLVADLAPYIEGAAEPLEPPELTVFDVFAGGPTGMDPWVYDNLDALGLDASRHRPKVYTALVTARTPVVARSEAEARAAFGRGHDCVVYVGPRRVGDAPEVALRDGSAARIVGVELA